MSGIRRIGTVIVIWCAVHSFMICGAASSRAAENYGGFSSPMAFLMAELKKQDTATLADAVLEIWQIRTNQDSLFCKEMEGKPNEFRLWCTLLSRFSSEATSDTALARVQQFRSRVIDPKSGILSRPSRCRSLDSALVAVLKSADGASLVVYPALTSDQASRKIAFWNVLWQHRSDFNRRRCGRPMLDLLRAVK